MVSSVQEDQVTVVYDTMWDGTKKLAHKIAEEIAKQSLIHVLRF